MRVLCIGTNSQHTDLMTRRLANQRNEICVGLLTNTTDTVTQGFYHTSMVDISYSSLMGLAAQFDEIVVLDQTPEQYSHKDLYYQTVVAAQDLAVSHNVVWQNPSMGTGIGFFEQLVVDNPSFCIFPWIELMTTNDHTVVCCRSTTPVVKLEDLKDFATDANYQSIRQAMLEGKRLPAHCATCYKTEALGIPSARQQETVIWANRLGLKNLTDLEKIQSPVYYEVRPSNVCNLACRMCAPSNSELVNQEYAKLKIIQQPVKYKYSNFDIVDLSQVQKLYVAGGEPLAMPDFFDFLDRCIESRYNFDFTVNTNATKLSDKFKKQLKHLPHLQFIVSLDGFGDLNHYIRWPSNWQTTIDNVRYLVDQKHYVCFNTTVSMYNVADLYELLAFFDQEFPGTLVHCQMAEGWTSPLNFTDSESVIENLSQIKNLQCYQNDWSLSSFIDSIIKYFENPNKMDPTMLEQFAKRNLLLDQNRGVDVKHYAPKLWKVLEPIYNRTIT